MKLNSHIRTVEIDALQARIGLRLAARLNERCLELPGDVAERLRVAREHAVRRASLSSGSNPVVAQSGAVAALAAGAGTPWWLRLASATPLLLLLAGLLLIQHIHDRAQMRAAAEFDAALLSDDLPPAAYRDPGFVEFLKQRRP